MQEKETAADEEFKDEVLLLKVLWWHHIFCVIPLIFSFVLLLLLKRGISIPAACSMSIASFLAAWLAETFYLHRLGFLPIVKVDWKKLLRGRYSTMNSINHAIRGPIPLRDIFFSPYLLTNYAGWMLMFLCLGLVLYFG